MDRAQFGIDEDGQRQLEQGAEELVEVIRAAGEGVLRAFIAVGQAAGEALAKLKEQED